MKEISVYNTDGQKQESIALGVDIPQKEKCQQAFSCVIRSMLQNWRQGTVGCKARGDVSFSNKKPWKQKGTGRARHGSNRSPLWVGGGVTFGPLNTRNYKQKIQKKMNQLAVRMCLSSKLKEDKFIVLEDLQSDGKTGKMVELRKALPGVGKTTLLLMEGVDEKVNLATRNITKLDMQQAKDVNVVDLMHHQYIIITKKAVEKLEKRLAK